MTTVTAGRAAGAAHVIVACYLGWTLDAFDFFIMIFAFNGVAHSFGISSGSVAAAVTLTLACRFIGAILFGRIADRFGRRPTMMANVMLYAVLELLSGFAPSFTVFLILRGLYGIADLH